MERSDPAVCAGSNNKEGKGEMTKTPISLQGLRADACLYFGGAPPEFVQPPTGLYARTEYGGEIRRRRNILNLAMSPK